MSSVPQVIVGAVGRAMQLIGNHAHFRAIQAYVIVHVTVSGFASCNYLAVISTIILKLHSNVCDYLY